MPDIEDRVQRVESDVRVHQAQSDERWRDLYRRLGAVEVNMETLKAVATESRMKLFAASILGNIIGAIVVGVTVALIIRLATH